MRLDIGSEVIFFCFFYAPGAHHPLPVRNRFYDIFTTKFSAFEFQSKIYMLGDTNAKLGSFLKDKNIHGKFSSYANAQLLRDFIDFFGLIVLNKTFCLGVPTYEIVNRKMSSV